MAQVGIELPFELMDTAGHRVTDRDFRGRWLLVYFGYTSCPDVCPTTLGEIGSAMEMLGASAARLQPLFISVDPQRDTPEILREYLSAFGGGIVGLTGTQIQVAHAAGVFGAVFYKIPSSTPIEYSIAHSGRIYVVGPEGGLVTRLPTDADAGRIVATLRALLQ